MKKMNATRTLTDRQKYLLGRIPSLYDLNGEPKITEPSDIKTYRRLVSEWDERQRRESCKQKKRNEALIRKARESVYFDSEQKALDIVRQVEKLLKGCD